MAGLVIEGAESELLASPLAIINSSSEPIDPDVNLKWRKQNQKHERDWPVKLVVLDLCLYQSNCVPTPLLTQH